jgi:Holliday junction resolvase RusA-like endonuclease
MTDINAGWVEVPIPPSTNHLWEIVFRRGRPTKVKTKQYQSWLEVAVLQLRVGLGKAPVPACVAILIRGGKGWGKHRDIDNVVKAVIDALVHAELLQDDSCDFVHGVSVSYLQPIEGMPAGCFVRIDSSS